MSTKWSLHILHWPPCSPLGRFIALIVSILYSSLYPCPSLCDFGVPFTKEMESVLPLLKGRLFLWFDLTNRKRHKWYYTCSKLRLKRPYVSAYALVPLSPWEHALVNLLEDKKYLEQSWVAPVEATLHSQLLAELSPARSHMCEPVEDQLPRETEPLRPPTGFWGKNE